MMRDNLELFELSAEIEGASALVNSLSLHFDNDGAEKLSETCMRTAMFGVVQYLDRISEDISEMERRYDLQERTVAE